MDSSGPSQLYPLLFGRNVNYEVRERIELLQENGLIPREFMEYLSLKGLQEAAMESKEKQTMQGYLALSGEFLKRHPETIYEGNVHVMAAQALEKAPGIIEGQDERLEHELKAAIGARHKEYLPYQLALGNLANHYSRQGRGEDEKIMREAANLHRKRNFDGDPSLHRNGVTDYLKANGAL